MSCKSIVLSSFGLKYVLSNNLEGNEFRFIFGKEEIKMNKIFAEFLSPVVSHLHQCDPTINFLNYEDIFKKASALSTKNFDNLITKNIVFQLQNMYNGYPIEIKSEEVFNFRVLSIILGNEELFKKINENFPIDFNTVAANQLIEELQIYQFFSSNFELFQYENFSEIIDHISSHFLSIDHSKLKLFSKQILYSILEKNQQINEDVKLDFIQDLFSNSNEDDEEFNKNRFYELIDFSKLSREKLVEFLIIMI